jgi:hypothetical protein
VGCSAPWSEQFDNFLFGGSTSKGRTMEPCSCHLVPHFELLVNSTSKRRTMEPCSCHLVPHFEECSRGVAANCEFKFFWELQGTFELFLV